MYLAHYGLIEPPFAITPDPRFVFLSERHRDALAHLMFGIDQGGGGGFVQLTGEVGTGKTTLCRVLMEQLPVHARVALVLNPQLSPVELLETICEELHLDIGERRGSRKALVDLLNVHLLQAYAEGQRVVLVIDEAQNLSSEALEQVRLLTNLETPTQKLLQIILLGQPELRGKLARPELRQLAQRITARFHLTPLDEGETLQYLRHRWRVAGGQHFPFSPAVARRIHRHAGGVPRLINVIAERCLLAGYANDALDVKRRWVDRAEREALAPSARRASLQPVALGLVAAAGVLALALLWWRTGSELLTDATATTASAASTPPAAEAMGRGAEGAAATQGAVTSASIIPIDGQDLSRRLQAGDATQAAAVRALLALWMLPIDAASLERVAACTGAVAAQVQCVRGGASLDKLAALGRPAVLRLRSEGADAWALLLGLGALNARLQVGGDVVDVDRIALARAWTGDYLALWKAPAGHDPLPAALGRGARGPVIDWVAAQLQPRYLAAPDGPVQVDAAMREAIRNYQLARGLASDGVIGPETLMAMASAGDGARLQRVLE